MKRNGPDLAEALGSEATDKRIDILRRIDEVGSISEAARRAGVSYKAAWQALETLSNLAGMPLVETAVGGSGGGGAMLTIAGRRVLDAAALLAKARSAVVGDHGQGTRGRAGGVSLPGLGLRTSMRNQLPCVVAALSATRGLVRVELVLPNGESLYSRVTRESAQLLGLTRGMQLLALCKATAVLVERHIEPGDSHNLLQGRVSRVSRVARGGEISLQLDRGLNLVGFAAAGHGLKAGRRAVAAVEESAVVLAIPS
jgi:molybdate transport system regulatory protein